MTDKEVLIAPHRPSSPPDPVPAADTAVQELATLLQLGRRAREAESVEALGFILVNETRQLLRYRQAALGRANALGHWLPADVLAVSGLPQPDPQAPYVQWLAQLLRSVLAQPDIAARRLDAQDLPELLARDWTAWLPAHALLLPLTGPGGRALGALLLAREGPWDDHELALAAEAAHSYGHALARFLPTVPWRERLRRHVLPKKHRWKVALALVAVCLIPVHLTVLAPAEVVPRKPFLVRAPLDGVIDKFHVQPNQAVKAGDPLFDLDTTSLRSRYSVARKAYDVAAEEYRQAAQQAVTDERSKLDVMLRKGRLEEKALDLNYSKQLLDRVQVKAARDGVAVFADVNDWQGRAVSIGERVLTLADPDKVELAVSLPVADAIDLPDGAAVTLYPNGTVFTSYDASLKSFAYHAEPTPNGVLAYRLKAAFAGGEKPRIGLMGMAKIRGGWVPLVYYVLRRPLAAARQWLGW